MKLHVDPRKSLRIADENDNTIASTTWPDNLRDSWESNAAELVRRWNLHEQLVEALEEISSGPFSRNCDFCFKTTRFTGKDKIENHRSDCPLSIAEAALKLAQEGM